MLNPEATGMQKGFARPGYFFIDTKGIIREKFFEAKYRERQTGNSIIAKLFPELGEEVTQTVRRPALATGARTIGSHWRAGDAHYTGGRSTAAGGCARICARGKGL